MTQLDDRILPLIPQLLTSLGKTVRFFVVESGEYSPESGSVGPGTTTAVDLKATPPEAMKVGLQDGDIVKVGDVRILIAAEGLAFTPEATQQVKIDSDRWRIVHTEPIYSGEEIAAYQIQLRK